MSKAKPKIEHVELTAHRPLSQRTAIARGVAKGRQTAASALRPRGFRKFGALILGLSASTKCMATTFCVGDSKEIKHAVDNAENFTQAKQRKRKEESSSSVKKHLSATDGS